ncbi:MAG TPA: hypothetical protein EYG65_14525 [Rhodospirillales bacterium]|nr:hypothetical protein [Rhodospirillales bacterium]HIP10934.1 hypothetical protein [Rhodospirillales bacterium]
MKKGSGLYSGVRRKRGSGTVIVGGAMRKRKRGSGTTLVGGAVRKRRRRRKKTKGSGFVAWGRGKNKGGLLRASAQFANKFQITRKQPRATFLPGATWNPAFQKGAGVSWHSGGGVVIGGGAFRGKRVVHRQGRGRRLI